MLLCPLGNRRIFLFFILLVTSVGEANFSLLSMKRVAIFPARGVNESQVDEVWWQVRETVALDGRFDVATRRLMINRQVLAPRAELKPADAVILGKVLDADILISHYLLKKKAIFSVVRAFDGQLLWREEMDLNSSIPEVDQVIPIFKRLASLFLAAVPYAGYQVLSPQSRNLYEADGNLGYVFVMIPNSENLVGQKIYWVNVSFPSPPLLKSKRVFRVLNSGEGVDFTKPNLLKVKLHKPFDESYMSVGTLVYLGESNNPDDLSEVQFGSKLSEAGSEYLVSNLKPERRIQEQSAQATFLGFISSLAALLLFAL